MDDETAPGRIRRAGRWVARRWAGVHILDRIAWALLVAGGIAVASGLLEFGEARATVDRILPLLLFLATVIVLAELTAEAEVFDVIATRVAILGRGGHVRLFVLCVLFAALTTVTLNLDTTAVLLTPVMVALARKISVPAVPLAVTTVWLANTASLLLPVSNLTNLLAANRVALPSVSFAARMWAPEVLSVAATMLCLWVFFWRRQAKETPGYVVPVPHRPRDRVTFAVAGAACGGFVVAVVAGVTLGIASAAAAAVVVVVTAVRSRASLRWGMIPWRLLVFVTGLFLVVQTISDHGLSSLVAHLIGASDSTGGLVRTSLVGAGLANVVNNLPAYVAAEAVIPGGHRTQLLALLVGTNVGPIVLPWASLATLLWFERCRAMAVTVPIRRFLVASGALAVLGVGAAVAGLALTS